MLKFVGLLFVTLFISSLISYVSLKSIIIEHNKNHLKNAIVLMQFELDNVNNLDTYATKINQSTNLRVTIINENGVVIAESSADKKTMDNHANRYEIMHANQEDFPYIIRFSKTLKVDFLYMAQKTTYRDENIYIRLSMNLGQIMSDFYSLWSKLAFAFIIVIFISFYISKKMSEKIFYDIEQITKYLDEISNKNYKAIIKTKNFYEFLQISLMLKNLVKKLSNRDKQKRKYTAKLRLMNKQRNDILSAISHEFKNPIASIVGYAQTLQEEPDIEPKIRDRFLSKINSNGEKISQMLDRLALSVKLENNDLDIKPSTFELNTLCEEVVANLRLKYRDREITVDAEKTSIYADKTMIELALINLVDNALKYSQTTVSVILKDDVVYIQDKGIGIQEEYIDKISSKFYRVKKNSWDNSMGIGLAMVSYILNAHSSSLNIQSKFGEGSTFSFSVENMQKK